MNRRRIGWVVGLAILTLGVPVSAYVLSTRAGLFSEVSSEKIRAVARAYPNFTLEQRRAIDREISAEVHPTWQSLPLTRQIARLASMAARLMASAPHAPVTSPRGVANFVGNQTIISNPSYGFIALQRQANCALTLFDGGYSAGSALSFQIQGITAHFELALHQAAGLTTRADVFPGGCTDKSTGLSARRAVNLGPGALNQTLLAWSFYDFAQGDNELYIASANPATLASQPINASLGAPGVTALATGDLNNDGIPDLVGFNPAGGAILVALVGAGGAVHAPVPYAVPGTVIEALVLADVNGDGRLDAIVATADASGHESVSVLTGRGDGTLNAAQTVTVSSPAPIVNLITADLRGGGRQDLIASNGMVWLNDGSGKFTATSPAFAPLQANSQYGPNLAAADFNHDGKVDLAVGDGVAVHILVGRGDGTFAAGNSYASIGNIGYLAAVDLDGDGHVDLFSGLGNAGGYSGDPFDWGAAYALMGNGDGSFQGSPEVPFVYNGNNLVDLTGSGILDGVGVNSNGSFTSYLGNGKGGFTVGPTLSFSSVTIGGQQYTLGNIDSYAFGDFNGDGKPDLAFVASNFQNGPAGGPGVFIALGDGHGGFGTPTYYAAPSTLASGDIDVNWTLYNLHVADLNHDGKADLVYNYSDTSYLHNTITFGTAVQLGKGGATFGTPQAIPYRSIPYADYAPTETSYVQLITDLNHDGFPDLVFVAQSTTIDQTLSTYVSTIQVALGNGDGTFSTPKAVTGPDIMILSNAQLLPASIAVADMNGDGIPDIVALGSSTGYNKQLAIALGNGDGSFRAPLLTNYTAQYLADGQGIAVGDFNGDGKPDVALTDPFVPNAAGISLGNGDGTVQTWVDTYDVLPGLAINLNTSGPGFVGDLNGDGRMDLLAGNLLLLGQAPLAPLPGNATYSAGQATLPTVFIGGASFSDMVVTLTKLAGAPTGSAPASAAIVYDPATGNVTVPQVTVGSKTYYNAVATVGSLVSVGSVSGADVYDGKNLTIPAVTVGTTLYTNVVITPGKILGVAGGMPKAALDQYDGTSRQLLIPAVEFGGKVYTNVTITVGTIVSVNGKVL
jgi:hypothetical protein